MESNNADLSLEELQQKLSELFQPNTEAVKQATAILKKHFKKVVALEQLLQLMSSSENQNIR